MTDRVIDIPSEILADIPPDLADASAFVERMAALYGARAADVLAALNSENAQACFWLNPLITGEPPELPEADAVAGLPGMYQTHERERLTHSHAAQTGQVYLQNPSSLLAVRLLDPQPGEEILDLAAAPGGKTIAIAAAMGNQGRIAAVEPVPGRFHRLRANVARCGAEIVAFYQKDGRSVGRAVPERFDRVLLDAPCSSEARMRWSQPASYRHWSLRKVRETSRKQKGLIRSAYAALKPGGRLLYCTCSFAVEENELIVEHLLRRTEARVLPLDLPVPHAQAGVTQSGKRQLDPSLAGSVRILPSPPWDGFYMAVLTKPSA